MAKSVTNIEYHCVTSPRSAYKDLLKTAKNEQLRVIEKDIETNKLECRKLWLDFVIGNLSQNLAFIVNENAVEILRVGNKFVSEDRFLNSTPGMMIRKDFCCKKK